MAENKLDFLDSLLEGAEISAEIVYRYLDRIKWGLDDEFCSLSFTCSVDLTAPIASVSYVKQLSSLFPQALISVYRNPIVMIIRYTDYPVRGQQLKKMLAKNEMRYGVSMVFNDFMRLRATMFRAALPLPTVNSARIPGSVFMKTAGAITRYVPLPR
jgi:hypothetical protein